MKKIIWIPLSIVKEWRRRQILKQPGKTRLRLRRWESQLIQ